MLVNQPDDPSATQQDLLRPQCLAELKRIVDAADVTWTAATGLRLVGSQLCQPCVSNGGWLVGWLVELLACLLGTLTRRLVGSAPWFSPHLQPSQPRRFWCSAPVGATPWAPLGASSLPWNGMAWRCGGPRRSVAGLDVGDEAWG